VQESFCKAANVAVLIVERRNELVVSGQVPFGVATPNGKQISTERGDV
jgi:hypothetical protein